MKESPTPESLRRRSVLGRFIAATDTARREFENVFGQPVRFVHSMPTSRSTPDLADLEALLIGGGYRCASNHVRR
jgi:hypothetical protein